MFSLTGQLDPAERNIQNLICQRTQPLYFWAVSHDSFLVIFETCHQKYEGHSTFPPCCLWSQWYSVSSWSNGVCVCTCSLHKSLSQEAQLRDELSVTLQGAEAQVQQRDATIDLVRVTHALHRRKAKSRTGASMWRCGAWQNSVHQLNTQMVNLISVVFSRSTGWAIKTISV